MSDPVQQSSFQPQARQVLLSDDGQGYDAATCNTCRTVQGPWPRPAHTLDECVTALAIQLAELSRV